MMYEEMVNIRYIKWAHLDRRFILALAVGMLSGFTFAYLMLLSSSSEPDPRFPFPLSASDPHSASMLEGVAGPVHDPGSHGHDEEFHRHEDTAVADILHKQVRILCWVMTGPSNHEKKARHVKATWGKRCNVLLFMSSKEDPTLPAVALPVGEGRDNLWAKTKEAFRYVYEKHFDEADWFLKADDDTYVILENLRYMLMPYKASEPLYFGCRFKPFVKQGYMSGGAGYVLSKESLKRFVEKALPNGDICSPKNTGSEDVEIGKCLERVDVRAMDTRDSHGRGRFFPFVPEHHLIPSPVNKDFWYWKYIYYESKQGMDCCSDNAVSFHYVTPNQMYVLEYLIYHLRPYGINHEVQPPPQFAEHKTEAGTELVKKEEASTHDTTASIRG